jgi:hypothetical protein
MRIYRLLLAALCVASFRTETFAQCSDAGICTIGKGHEARRHSAGISYAYGRSGKADDLTFHSAQLELGLAVLESSRLVAALPWTSQSGPLGSTSGLGDATVVWDQQLVNGASGSISMQFGVKIATGSVDAGGLPQRYQAGLGSNDLLFGLTYAGHEWSAAIGYQMSGGRSENKVDMLQRGDDLLLRAGFTFMTMPMTASAEVLAIKRLKESSVRNQLAAGSSPYLDIPGSDQFQINILGKAFLPLDESHGLQFSVAFPVLKRDINVDGLTRTLSLGTGFVYSF